MSGETWIAGIAAVAAIAAAIGAIWQAAQARQSARSAATDEEKAEAAATRAAAASERMALALEEANTAGERMVIALEEANALERARGQKPRWDVSVRSGRNTDVIRITNQGETAYNVSARILGVETGFGHSDTFPADVLEGGLAGTLALLKYGGMSADRVLQIEWSDEPGGEIRVAKVTT